MELRGTIPLEQRQRYMWLDVTAPSGGDCARCQMPDARCQMPDAGGHDIGCGMVDVGSRSPDPASGDGKQCRILDLKLTRIVRACWNRKL